MDLNIPKNNSKAAGDFLRHLRNVRFRRCGSKVKFKSKQHARRVGLEHGHKGAYYCLECKFWHISHEKQFNFKKQKHSPVNELFDMVGF